MSTSYAHVCHIANGTQLVMHDGVYMTQQLANAITLQGRPHTVHIEQLNATQQYLGTDHSTPPTLTRGLPTTAFVVKKEREVVARTALLPFEIRRNIFGWMARNTEAISEIELEQDLNGHLVPYQSFLPEPVHWYEQVGLQKGAEQTDGNIQLHKEYILESLRSCHFGIEHHFEMIECLEWLDSFSFSGIDTAYETGMDAVRSLGFGPYPQWEYPVPRYHSPDKNLHISLEDSLSFAMEFENLHSLSLSLRRSDFRVFDHYGGDNSRHFLAMLRTLHVGASIESVLESKHLKILEFRVETRNNWMYYGPDEGWFPFIEEFTQSQSQGSRKRPKGHLGAVRLPGLAFVEATAGSRMKPE